MDITRLMKTPRQATAPMSNMPCSGITATPAQLKARLTALKGDKFELDVNIMDLEDKINRRPILSFFQGLRGELKRAKVDLSLVQARISEIKLP